MFGSWGEPAGVRALITLLVALIAGAAAGPAHAATGVVRIEVLSNRADLISGGDALVRVRRPADAGSSAMTVTVGDRDVTSEIGDDGVGLITGLDNGPNVVTARLPDGRGARITITNHPIGGPVFTGPQVQPWVCNTQNPPANSGTSPTVVPVGLGPPRDAQCNTDPATSYVYKSTSTGDFQPYDPKSPPAESDIAMTTTDQGHKVRYVVRQEFGVEDRGIYAIAMLADPGGWNHKLLSYFGASTAPDHQQSQPSKILDDMALSRGFMTGNSGLMVNGQNTNENVTSEALMMLKEHIVETYGRIRYTIGQGCSGGSYQYMVAAMYPGLLDGIQPNCSYIDLWTTAPDVVDCGLIMHYFEANPHQPWVPAIDGHRDPSDCASWDALFYSVEDPANEGHCFLPDDQTYDAALRPDKVRCTLQDYQQAIWGPRPEDQWSPVEKQIGHGFANRPWGNAGVEYGLRALQSGQITPSEFVDLNAKIGGLTIDHQSQASRSVVDENTASIAYRAGQVTDAHQLTTVPIIDLRAYTETGEIHTSFYSYKARARLDKANGNHDNMLIWTFPAAEPILGVSPPPDIVLKSFLLMDKWLSRIEADDSGASLADKVVDDKPRDAVDACFQGAPGAASPSEPAVGASQEITDPGQCGLMYPHYGNTRTAAGGPTTDDIVQCRRKPVDPADYTDFGVTFTDDQLATLRKTFPGGVCDYSKPGIGQQRSKPWMTFEDGPGGRPLGDPPESVPFGPGSSAARGAACASRRTVRIHLRGARGARVRSVAIYLNGHRSRRLRGNHRRVSVRLHGRPRQRVRVTLVARVVRRGRLVTVRDRHTYHTCARKRR